MNWKFIAMELHQTKTQLSQWLDQIISCKFYFEWQFQNKFSLPTQFYNKICSTICKISWRDMQMSILKFNKLMSVLTLSQIDQYILQQLYYERVEKSWLVNEQLISLASTYLCMIFWGLITWSTTMIHSILPASKYFAMDGIS